MSEHIFITSSGEKIPVIIETRRGVRNITLRPKTICEREIHISKPWISSTNEALHFLESKHKWVEKIFVACPIKEQIKPGDTLCVLGNEYTITHNPNQRLNTTDKNIITIGGDIKMFEHRMRDLVKKQTMQKIKSIIRTTPPEFWPKKIALHDTTTRWGSCSSTGTMSFSWRLALAPYEVLRYVVMHELAHTQHMDHSPEFWHTVSELYGFGVERAKRWLNKNGQGLYKYL